MSPEVKAAAERLREILSRQSGQFSWRYMDGSEERDIADDIHLLLAEHPADDDEPVTEDWLKKLGFRESPLYMFRHSEIFGDFYLGPDEVTWLPVGTIEIGFKTRGDVRRLCSALGIESKEPAQ